MSDVSLYLRPGGFLTGPGARQAVSFGVAGLIGGGWSGFSLVEIIERSGVNVRREWRSYEDISQSAEGLIAQKLALVEKPVNDIAGFSAVDPRVQIMGIVNVTPDSFSDGGQFLKTARAIEHAEMMVQNGADLVDIGGESTRPGAEKVSLHEEMSRVIPVVSTLADAGLGVSIDTRNAEIMTKAAKAGAILLNDVTALTHCDDSVEVAARLQLPVCLMHAQGTPETMQDNPSYDDVVLDVYDYLAERIEVCQRAGIAADRIMVDPGIGFGKTVKHNLALLDQISIFHALGVAVLLGASRKSFIGAVSGEKDAANRLAGSISVAVNAARAGVQFLRVHDVAETRQALDVAGL